MTHRKEGTRDPPVHPGATFQVSESGGGWRLVVDGLQPSSDGLQWRWPPTVLQSYDSTIYFHIAICNGWVLHGAKITPPHRAFRKAQEAGSAVEPRVHRRRPRERLPWMGTLHPNGQPEHFHQTRTRSRLPSSKGQRRPHANGPLDGDGPGVPFFSPTTAVVMLIAYWANSCPTVLFSPSLFHSGNWNPSGPPIALVLRSSQNAMAEGTAPSQAICALARSRAAVLWPPLAMLILAVLIVTGSSKQRHPFAGYEASQTSQDEARHVMRIARRRSSSILQNVDLILSQLIDGLYYYRLVGGATPGCEPPNACHVPGCTWKCTHSFAQPR